VKGDGGPGFPQPLGLPGTKAIGVYGTTADPNGAGVLGENTAGGNAGEFSGNVAVSGNMTVSGNATVQGIELQVNGQAIIKSHANVGGNLQVIHDLAVSGAVSAAGTVTANDIILPNADCAEDFDIRLGTNVEPGTVMALDERGLLQESRHSYDKKVAGVISGAGKFKPGLILGRAKGQSGRVLAPAFRRDLIRTTVYDRFSHRATRAA
jgi:hypothetical protein